MMSPWSRRTTAAILLLAGLAGGQEITPPRNPIVGTDNVGGGSSTRGGVSIRREPAAPPKKITFVVVSPVRDWTDVQDRTIRASLVAFDDPAPTEGEAPDGEAETRERPRTLVREGKVRLWVEGSKKISEFPLARLSEADQLYVRKMVAAAAKAAETPAPADADGPPDGGE